jgi:hypothetical protein
MDAREAFARWMAETPAHLLDRHDDAKVRLDHCREALRPSYDPTDTRRHPATIQQNEPEGRRTLSSTMEDRSGVRWRE